ncbi:hypothetical protein NDU88_006136 [Pleurodeles waltl]|uniref:Uncharacterized protein n=1 Tax=Pleurodeles waltl TaxID=8319 RepID=A0AAV7WFD2_PLEWA|nr:hypothetical protein NDU88_006136 [Pleurodeles waltl]
MVGDRPEQQRTEVRRQNGHKVLESAAVGQDFPSPPSFFGVALGPGGSRDTWRVGEAEAYGPEVLETAKQKRETRASWLGADGLLIIEGRSRQSDYCCGHGFWRWLCDPCSGHCYPEVKNYPYKSDVALRKRVCGVCEPKRRL